jgi:hypothetical protein
MNGVAAKICKTTLSVDIYFIMQLVKDKRLYICWHLLVAVPCGVKIFNNFQSLLFESDLKGADIEASVSVLTCATDRRETNYLCELKLTQLAAVYPASVFCGSYQR